MKIKEGTQYEVEIITTRPINNEKILLLRFSKSIYLIGLTIKEIKELIDLLQKELIIIEQNNDNTKDA